MFQIKRSVHVYETDLMGIVHHSNYLRYCEEARIAWFRSQDSFDTSVESVFALTVYETQVRHLAPAKYGDELRIELQVRVHLAKLFFQYRLSAGDQRIALVKTVHCRLDTNFKVKRLDKNLTAIVEKELWTETWL
ncbi:MAG: hypothetical protein A2622_10495 [Bdellovibrionales bacterium RIFCSPHIGHO2_01_FULL_40_29]|nr:MAG: hypothetical protein A2622_10495 [Bdellovibrionales bacterium RIFCSPHIGHO2_01_FULL_40_29]OFZ34389.1 MAG: hypothetical protein A3D17_00760 [Bdellovibrionales bacterium RIFCSPHIGHO2_02_FULL_40_15]